MTQTTDKIATPELRFPEFKEEWRVKKLGEVTSFKSGGTPSKEVSKYWDGDIPWISASSMRGKYYEDSERKLTDEGVKNGSSLCSIGDLLILVRGSMLYKTVPVGIAKRELAFNQDVKCLKVDQGINNHFLYDWFQFSQNRFLNKVLGTGIGAGKLDTSDLKNTVIRLPSLPEQEKIAAFLTAVDDRLQALQKKKSLLEQYKKGIMQRVLNYEEGNDELRIRFKDEDGQDFPDWRKRLFSDILLEHKLKSTGKEQVHSVSVHKGVVNQVEHLGRSFAAKDTSNYSRALPFDIIYTKSPTGNFPFGIIKQNQNAYDVIVSPLYGVFTPETKELGYILNAYFESTINTSNYLGSIIQKGAKNTININNKTFLSKRLNLPTSKMEQKRIADFLTAIDRKIKLVEEQIAKTDRYKQGLLQKMFV